MGRRALGEQLTGDHQGDGRDRLGQIRPRNTDVGGGGERRVTADADGQGPA